MRTVFVRVCSVSTDSFMLINKPSTGSCVFMLEALGPWDVPLTSAGHNMCLWPLSDRESLCLGFLNSSTQHSVSLSDFLHECRNSEHCAEKIEIEPFGFIGVSINVSL